VDLPATTAAQAATLHSVPAVVEEAPQLSPCRPTALAVVREERPVLALRSETAARNTDGAAHQPTTAVRAVTAHLEPAIKRCYFFSALWESRTLIDNYEI
jgi:tRNA(Arg) A34 adenosine deaminase TadA